jgi:hypothetical protein
MRTRLFAIPVAALVVGCSFFSSPKGASVATFTAKEALCIYELRSEPVAQILKDCNVASEAINEVSTLVAGHRANDAKGSAAPCGVKSAALDAGK